jgi:hypothetical protein
MSAQQPLPVETRRAILQREVERYVGQGYRVVSQTDTTAQLVRPKHFSCLIATICLLLAVLPFVLYLLIYMGSRDSQVYLSVDDSGRLHRRG